MQIVPVRDLRDTNAISETRKNSLKSIFVMKIGLRKGISKVDY